jgi:hypothetical protein
MSLLVDDCIITKQEFNDSAYKDTKNIPIGIFYLKKATNALSDKKK